MKERVKNMLLVMVFFLYFGISNVLASDVKLILNGEPLELQMFNENNRVLVPLRRICEEMGYKVSWDGETRRVLIKKDFTKLIFTIDEKDIIVNNEKISIDVAPRIVDDRTYIPVRAFAEAFNNDVRYNENIINIKSNINGNKNVIVFLEKEEVRELREGRNVSHFVRVPQILNYNNEVAVDRINSYYKKEGCNEIECFRNCKDDDEWLNNIEYEGEKFDLLYNNGNIISFKRVDYFKGYDAKRYSEVTSGDIFNIKTGEKLRIQDILKGTNEEIEQFVTVKLDEIEDRYVPAYYKINKQEIENYVKDDHYYFCIENGRLILGAYFGENGIDISKNKKLFNERFLEAMFVKDTDEEYRVIESAHKYFNKEVKIIDKTILGQDECYVFDGKYEIIAIDRSGEKIYVVQKVDNNIYRIVEEKKANNEIGNLAALRLVMDKMNLKDYSYELGGILREDEDEYTIVTMRDLEEKVESSLAVNKKTGEILAYYFE